MARLRCALLHWRCRTYTPLHHSYRWVCHLCGRTGVEYD